MFYLPWLNPQVGSSPQEKSIVITAVSGTEKVVNCVSLIAERENK